MDPFSEEVARAVLRMGEEASSCRRLADAVDYFAWMALTCRDRGEAERRAAVLARLAEEARSDFWRGVIIEALAVVQLRHGVRLLEGEELSYEAFLRSLEEGLGVKLRRP